MHRFQQGSLFTVLRKRRPNMWVFRWYDYFSGRPVYKKQIIGSVAQLTPIALMFSKG
jgi:hypothetical protein